MIKHSFVIFSALTCLFLTSCSKSSNNSFKVAATPVPHAQMLEFIKPDLKTEGIDLVIVVTDDYNIPNRALASGEVDANFFQHVPFMEAQIQEFHYQIEELTPVEIEPMGIYSKKIKALSELKENSLIALPNDPTNEARALFLLQKEGIIKLDNSNHLNATILNIVENLKNLKFIEIDAAMLPRSLDDVTVAVINTNYALQAGLTLSKDALALEDKDSPYANIIAIRTADKEHADIKALKRAMTSQKMREFILQQYQGAIVPAFNEHAHP